MGKRCEDCALHFDVNHAIIAQLLEVGHLVGFAELAERTIQASLSLIEVICALRLANEGVIGIIGAGQRFKLTCQLLIQLGRAVYCLAQNCLEGRNKN